MKKASTYWLTSFRCFIWNVDIFFCILGLHPPMWHGNRSQYFHRQGWQRRRKEGHREVRHPRPVRPRQVERQLQHFTKTTTAAAASITENYFIFLISICIKRIAEIFVWPHNQPTNWTYTCHTDVRILLQNRVANNQCVQSVSLDLFAGLCIIRGDKDLIPKLCPFNKVLFKPIFISELLVGLDIQLGSEYRTFK